MRTTPLIIAGLAFAGSVHAQTASADSAAIVALELEMTELLSARRIDEYAAHLTADYARTTQQGRLELRDSALASWRSRGRARRAGGSAPPTDLWVRVYGDAAVLTGAVGGVAGGPPRTRITKTFVRQRGRWLLAALHGSAIAER